MEELLLKGALKEGFTALLFVGLLVHQLRENKNRETRLMDFLDVMKEQFVGLTRQYERLSDDVEDLKNRIDRRY